MIKPLKGLRFVDFSWVGAGPFTTKMFADFGAEVIKVESSTRPDQLRKAEPLIGQKDLNSSGYFSNRNTNKKSITLNMKHPKSREIVLALVEQSDAIINSFTPNTMDKFGLSYEDVKKVKPDIIYLSMPMQGNWGPHKDFLGFGSSINAIMGLTYLTSLPGQLPVGSGTNYPDHVPNPCHAAFALFSALEYREKTGKGQNIELSQTESSICVYPDAFLNFTVNGRETQPLGNRHDYKAPHGVYPCAGDDRWCAISVSSDSEWEKFCKAIGQESLLQDAQFQSQLYRNKNSERLDQIVSDWTRQHRAEDVMQILQSSGVPAGVVQNAEDLVANDQNFKHRQFWQWLDHPVMGNTLYHGVPYTFSTIPNRYHTPAPLLGEHNEEIIGELAGYSNELSALKQDGVIE